MVIVVKTFTQLIYLETSQSKSIEVGFSDAALNHAFTILRNASLSFLCFGGCLRNGMFMSDLIILKAAFRVLVT